MSVTFSAANNDVMILDGAPRTVVMFVEGPEAEALEINVSNSNAVEIGYALGFQAEDMWEGCSDEAASFLGRVMVAQGAAPVDAGRPATQEGNLVNCGRSAGYLQDRLAQLRTLAEWAVANGHGKISWG